MVIRLKISQRMENFPSFLKQIRIMAQSKRKTPRIAKREMDSFQKVTPQKKGTISDIDARILVSAIGPQERAINPVYILMHRQTP